MLVATTSYVIPERSQERIRDLEVLLYGWLLETVFEHRRTWKLMATWRMLLRKKAKAAHSGAVARPLGPLSAHAAFIATIDSTASTALLAAPYLRAGSAAKGSRELLSGPLTSWKFLAHRCEAL